MDLSTGSELLRKKSPDLYKQLTPLGNHGNMQITTLVKKLSMKRSWDKGALCPTFCILAAI